MCPNCNLLILNTTQSEGEESASVEQSKISERGTVLDDVLENRPTHQIATDSCNSVHRIVSLRQASTRGRLFCLPQLFPSFCSRVACHEFALTSAPTLPTNTDAREIMEEILASEKVEHLTSTGSSFNTSSTFHHPSLSLLWFQLTMAFLPLLFGEELLGGLLGEELLGGEVLGEELLGDEVLGDEVLGEDLFGDEMVEEEAYGGEVDGAADEFGETDELYTADYFGSTRPGVVPGEPAVPNVPEGFGEPVEPEIPEVQGRPIRGPVDSSSSGSTGSSSSTDSMVTDYDPDFMPSDSPLTAKEWFKAHVPFGGIPMWVPAIAGPATIGGVAAAGASAGNGKRSLTVPGAVLRLAAIAGDHPTVMGASGSGMLKRSLTPGTIAVQLDAGKDIHHLRHFNGLEVNMVGMPEGTAMFSSAGDELHKGFEPVKGVVNWADVSSNGRVVASGANECVADQALPWNPCRQCVFRCARA